MQMMNTTETICRICDGGHLHPQIRKNNVEYKDVQAEIDLACSVCDVCGSEQAAGNQLRANKRAMIKFKKTVDGLLTGEEVRAIREMLKLSQAEAAKVFGGGPVAFSKYENDDVAQSEAMDKMIRLAAELPTAFDHLARLAGIKRAITVSGWSVLEGLSQASTTQHRPKLRIVERKVNKELPRYAT